MVDMNETAALRRMQQGEIDCVLDLEITAGTAPFQFSDRRINNGSAIILTATNRAAGIAIRNSPYFVEVSDTNVKINNLIVGQYPATFKAIVLGVPTSGRLVI